MRRYGRGSHYATTTEVKVGARFLDTETESRYLLVSR